MKGIVFTELIDFIERHTSVAIAESIIDETELESGGAFTSVGNYPHSEAVKLVVSASERLDTPVADLMRQFGKELFATLLNSHPQFIDVNTKNAFAFLAKVQNHIHVEVAKLYADADLPVIQTSLDEDKMIVRYESHRPFAMLAMGLIEGCCAHFDDTLVVELQGDPNDATNRATFSVTRKVLPGFG
jgi:hypothetical protein